MGGESGAGGAAVWFRLDSITSTTMRGRPPRVSVTLCMFMYVFVPQRQTSPGGRTCACVCVCVHV